MISEIFNEIVVAGIVSIIIYILKAVWRKMKEPQTAEVTATPKTLQKQFYISLGIVILTFILRPFAKMVELKILCTFFFGFSALTVAGAFETLYNLFSQTDKKHRQ